MISTLSTIASGRTPNLPVNSVKTARTPIGCHMHHNTTLRTQTFIIRGHDKHGQWKQMRVKATDADGARYIAHQNNLRVAECVQVETKI